MKAHPGAYPLFSRGDTAIIGAGITGIVAGYTLHTISPDIPIHFVDAGPDPLSADAGQHHGTTLGSSRDARHFTGTEGLSFQNPTHTRLLYEEASVDGAGWQTIPEKQLTARERTWRIECRDRYERHVTPSSNPYDEMYTALNYGGMAAWRLLTALNPALAQYRTHEDGIYVAFSTQAELDADFRIETEANPHQNEIPVIIKELDAIHSQPEAVLATESLAKQVLRVPGEAWRIKSLWQHLYHELRAKPTVRFDWNTHIRQYKELPVADNYIWANGSGYAAPNIIDIYGRAQGVGGWWLSLPNPGFQVPFKVSAPQPSGYMNFTPDDNLLHISGGFGWTGKRGFQEASKLLEPARQHFLRDTAHVLGMSVTALAAYEVGCCLRPTTPTGLPDLTNVYSHVGHHITLSGAGKAGATQAPILGLYVASKIAGYSQVEELIDSFVDISSQPVIKEALALAHAGFEPTTP